MYIIEFIYDRIFVIYEMALRKFLLKLHQKQDLGNPARKAVFAKTTRELEGLKPSLQDLGNPARKEVFAKTSPKAGFSKTIFYIFSNFYIINYIY